MHTKFYKTKYYVLIMKFRLFLFFIMIGYLVNISFCALDLSSNVNYLYFYQDDVSATNKVAYEIIFNDNLFGGDIFKFEALYDGEVVNTCENELIFDDTSIYKKIVCDVNKMGDGSYDFVAKIIRDGQTLITLNNQVYVLDNINAQTDFLDLNDSTIVFLNVEGKGENLVVSSRIPKEVIENLDDDNKDNLILSDLEYEIIENDPLIAWSIEKAPAKVNYTINKKISDVDKENFKLEITQKKEFLLFKAFIFVLIFIIIIIILKPLIFKKK